MLVPKRIKHRRAQRGRTKSRAIRGDFLAYGDFGIQATTCGWITNNQIEAMRAAINRYIRRGGKLWTKIFPDKPVTEKPAGTRMGSNRGLAKYWVAVVKPSRVLFKLSGVDEERTRGAVRFASHKLPIKAKFVARRGSRGMSGEE